MYKLQPKTLFTGKNAIYLPTCHSTNDSAAEIIQKSDITEGTIVITDNRTHGKGQRGNTWVSRKGENLTFTVILKPDFMPVDEQFKLNMAVSLAVIETLSEYLDGRLKIKWPNDIFYGDKKLGGILIESIVSKKVMSYSFVGVGLNINQQEFSLPLATSLKRLTDNENYDLSELLTKFSENLEKEYLALKNTKDVCHKTRYVNNLFRKDEWHQFKNENGIFDGKIKGVNEYGKLIIETKFGLKQFATKEFEYIY